jgi:rhamnosyltransferase
MPWPKVNNKYMKLDRATRGEYVVGLIIYHPGESLIKRVGQMIELGFKVYVFDNSPADDKYTHAIKKYSNIFYLTAGKNVGIGYALSTLCATANSHGYQKLLFLDQDTGISGRTLEFIEAYTTRLDIDAQRQYAALVFSGEPSATHSVQEVRLAISSGSLFNLSVLKQIGWHNANYFVDCVDYELCLRARRFGFKIGHIRNTPDFDHVTEQPDRSLSLFGKILLVRRYSASRIKDALGAYLKLIFCGLFKNQPSDTYAVTRSMGIYVFGQIISRFIQSK